MKTNNTQRTGLKAALDVAQQITETSSVDLHDVTTRSNSVDVMVYRQPEDVVVLGNQFRFRLELREQLAGNGKPLMEARGSVGAVSVRFWALGGVDDWDRYREVLASGLVSLPGAWVAAGAA